MMRLTWNLSWIGATSLVVPEREAETYALSIEELGHGPVAVERVTQD